MAVSTAALLVLLCLVLCTCVQGGPEAELLNLLNDARKQGRVTPPLALRTGFGCLANYLVQGRLAANGSCVAPATGPPQRLSIVRNLDIAYVAAGLEPCGVEASDLQLFLVCARKDAVAGEVRAAISSSVQRQILGTNYTAMGAAVQSTAPKTGPDLGRYWALILGEVSALKLNNDTLPAEGPVRYPEPVIPPRRTNQSYPPQDRELPADSDYLNSHLNYLRWRAEGGPRPFLISRGALSCLISSVLQSIVFNRGTCIAPKTGLPAVIKVDKQQDGQALLDGYKQCGVAWPSDDSERSYEGLLLACAQPYHTGAEVTAAWLQTESETLLDANFDAVGGSVQAKMINGATADTGRYWGVILSQDVRVVAQGFSENPFGVVLEQPVDADVPNCEPKNGLTLSPRCSRAERLVQPEAWLLRLVQLLVVVLVMVWQLT